ncbi:hypothetical protein FOL46_000067 [Perkinsus olseni]|uniref:Uncharacterized protein n=1 Tax=Perkinsus olseni TaxID=32597 RepID=A0A7J6MYX9_PEROL|nr:hypothetical protein FOL46_000067 [Perkinsus olseni]
MFQALTNQLAETNKMLSNQMAALCNAMSETVHSMKTSSTPSPQSFPTDDTAKPCRKSGKAVSISNDEAATKAKKTVDKADLSFLGSHSNGVTNYWTGDSDDRSVTRLKTLLEAQHLYRFGDWAVKYLLCLRVLAPSIREVAAMTVEHSNVYSTFEDLHDALRVYLIKEYSSSHDDETSRGKLQALKMNTVKNDAEVVTAYDRYLQRFGLIRIEFLHEHVEDCESSRLRNSEELAHYFYHGLSDRVKHKLISEIKDAAIYKDLDRLKDISRHVCRVLSKKAKTKSPSASALDFQEEIVDICRPFYNRSLRQAEANNVEATITNDHIKTFKCQRCLSNDHSTVLCPASDAKELRPMPVEQRKLIFDRVKAKRTPTTTTVKDSQVNLVALSTSKTRSDSSLTNIDIYLNTDNKLRYKQSALVDSGASHCFIHPDLIHQWNRAGVEMKVLPAGHAATSSDGSKDPIPIDTAVVLPVTFSTTECATITIKCYVYPDLSHQMLLSSSVLREAGCLWFMLPGYADCMLLGESAQELRDILDTLGIQPRPLERSSSLAPDHLSLNCLNLQALCYDGLDTNWESTHRLMSCTLQLGTGNGGPESSDLYADEQEALRRCEELAIAQSPMSVPPTEAFVADFEIKGYPSRHDVTSHAHTTDYKSKMNLQSPRWYQDLQDLSEELREQRQVTLKGYLDFWKDRRDDMYHRAILDRGSDHRNDLGDGCMVYRWAPREDKLAYQWMGPFIFQGFHGDGKSMGVIQDPTSGATTIESMLNLKKSYADPTISCAVNYGLPPLPVGTRISMPFATNGKDQDYGGVIEKVNPNGLLTILFDDGERYDDIDPKKEKVTAMS